MHTNFRLASLNQSLNVKVVALLDVDAVDPSSRDVFVGFLRYSMILSFQMDIKISEHRSYRSATVNF